MKISSLNEAPGYISGVVFEAGLSRLDETINTKQFIIATAWRSSKSLKENIRGNQKIIHFCNAHKLGVYRLIGHWDESPDGMSYEEAKDKHLLTAVTEDSLLIPKSDDISADDFKQFAIDLCKLCSQDSVVYKDEDGMFKYLNSAGGETNIGRKFTWHDVGDAYSTLRGYPDHPFKFEGSLQPGSVMDRMSFKQSGIKWFSESS